MVRHQLDSTVRSASGALVTMARSCRYWIEQFHQDYLQRGKKEETWVGDYWKVLKRLPQGEPISKQVLHALVLSYEPNTKARARACFVLGAIAKFAKVTYDPSPYKGNYSTKGVQPRQIPTDEAIVEAYYGLKNEHWRWVFGMIAAYGLRPHECFRLEVDRLMDGDKVCYVGEDTKTGFRRVWAFHPEWFDEFNLSKVSVPPIDLSRTNKKVGESASRYFYETAKLPFKLYDMRHAWAIRTILYDLPPELAAQQMGHSLEVHNRIYHRWIGRSIHQSVYDKILNNPNRPQAPKFLDRQ